MSQNSMETEIIIVINCLQFFDAVG